jgi:hypothetical protein
VALMAVSLARYRPQRPAHSEILPPGPLSTCSRPKMPGAGAALQKVAEGAADWEVQGLAARAFVEEYRNWRQSAESNCWPQ